MITGYDIFYLGLAPLAAPLLGWRALTRGKYRESAPGMFGRGLAAEDPAMWRGGCVWVHSVSVGETMAAKAMLPLLRRRFPDLPLLVTTVTETGQALARSLVPESADAARYYPADFSWIVRRFVSTFRPRVFIPMETEIWPNALNIISDSGARIVMMNGRVGESSFRTYKRLGRAFRGPLGRVGAFCMQTEDDAARMRELSGAPDRVFVTGNCKFDTAVPELSEEERRALRAELGLGRDEPVIVAGSTHPGEEEIVLAAIGEIRRTLPDAAVVLVPRHPERFGRVWGLLQSSGVPARRLSDGSVAGPSGSPAVVLVDRMGMLVRLYGIADVALVAGSFVPGIGGHNVLEAAAHGVPVIYGPHMEKQPELVRLLDAENGGTVSPADRLGADALALLLDRDAAAAKGRLGREAVSRNRGSAARNMDILERCL